jgi:hypothetical protein
MFLRVWYLKCTSDSLSFQMSWNQLG